MKVRGVNLQNWLVLEKWMGDSPLSKSQSDDEHGMMAEYGHNDLEDMLELHRSTYVTKETFEWLAKQGCNVVRIPIPYHLFGSSHHRSSSKYLNKAFQWAEDTGIGILIDLHTVPYGQNGADHGGYIGMCRWHQSEDRVRRTLAMLSRVVGRYAKSPAFWGIDPLNEPGNKYDFERLKRRWSRNPSYRSRFEGSEPMSRRFLMQYYEDFYHMVRSMVGDELRIVLNDNFYLPMWDNFMGGLFYKNVYMDTHRYVSFHKRKLGNGGLADHIRLTRQYGEEIARAAKYHPVIVGEWSASASCPYLKDMDESSKADWYMTYTNEQLDAWDRSEGGFFTSLKVEFSGAWSFEDCVKNGWVDLRHGI